MLLVHLWGKHLVDTETYISSPFCNVDVFDPQLSAITQSTNEYDKLLSYLLQIITLKFATLPTKRGVEDFIETTGFSISACALAYLQTSSPQPKLSLTEWRPWGLFDVRVVAGPVHSKWCERLQTDGALAGIIDVSMM